MTKTGKKIHTRQIDITIHEGAFDSIIVEGILRDERLVDSYRSAGEMHPPGTIHHMIITMEVKGPQLVIEDIAVEMPTIPHAACIATRAALLSVKGLPIMAGFSVKVKRLLGGTKGCVHLLTLLLSMASAAVQGAWSAMAQKPLIPEIHVPMALKLVQNSCWVWREDGPLVQEWRTRLKPDS